MDDTLLVGIIGGYGAVGSAAAHWLAAEGGFRLRVGGRNAQAAWAFARRLGPMAQAGAVDVMDDQRLRHFCRGCWTVLDCTGPAGLLGPRVQQAALVVGSDYVAPRGRVGPCPPGRQTVVFSAGLAPGLSGLLPKVLAEGLIEASAFSGYAGGLGPLSRSYAVDRVLGHPDSTPGAIWRGNRITHHALRTDTAFQLPSAARPVTGHPCLTEELHRQAHVLPLDEARWYEVFDGSLLPAAVDRLRDDPPRADDAYRLDAAAAELVRASVLDATDRAPYHVVHGVLDGRAADGSPVRRSILVRGANRAQLTGAIAAMATSAVTRRRIPPGTHDAADVLPPREVIDRLRRLPGTTVAFGTRSSAGL
jgi:hypothetical protein